MLIFGLILLVVVLSIYILFPRRVPILMYHRIASVPGERNALPVEKFTEQLNYLQSHEYNTITLTDFYNHHVHGTHLPPRPIILTFDDGYEDNYLTALPLLLERKMKATVFPIVNWIGKENKWENFHHQLTRTMNWEQLQKWHTAGMEIGSHTLEHPFLTKCDEARLEQELMKSKQVLEAKLGINIDFLCFPYGFFDDNTKTIARKAGYKGALAIFAQAPLWNPDLFALARIPISSRQPLWEFALKVSRLHIVFNLLRKIERSSKSFVSKRKKQL
jgi:peptidoglycan/xylan/chitin deacetylase (PgdA/CDA1 family)